METVFRISNCSVENQIKFSTCTLLAGALTWWNSHVRIVGHDVAYAMTWIDLRKKMTDKYCLRNEIKKLEAELWNLKVKGSDVTGYKPTFLELALLTFAERQAENKRKLDNNPKLNNNFPKRQNVVQAYRQLGPVKRKEGSSFDRDSLSSATTNNQRTLTYECGKPRALQSDCPKLRLKPWKPQAEVVRFGKRGKLNPRDAGPFKALARVEALAYKLSCLERTTMRGPEFIWECEDRFQKKYLHLNHQSASSCFQCHDRYAEDKAHLTEDYNTRVFRVIELRQ
ncbi:hypothetical protein Tco_0665658 [Tanacetum coccineum]